MDVRGERLAHGDPAAFAELYDACAVRVHHYLTVRLGAQADADDVLQETFLRLVRERQSLAAVENTGGLYVCDRAQRGNSPDRTTYTGKPTGHSNLVRDTDAGGQNQ